MPNMDSTAKAAIAHDFAAAWFIWLDISGDPIRVTTAGKDITFASTGDADLDGNTFTAFGGRAIQVGDVANSDSGSEPLTVDLSGIVSIDAALLADIGNKALWQGRTCRVWFLVYDASGVTAQGGVVSHYTGYMSDVGIIPSPESQIIRLKAENYIAISNQASNRDYLNQKDYDSADASAAATLAAANGAHHGGGASNSSPGAVGGVASTGIGDFTGGIGSAAAARFIEPL